jgi:hypothetical protein
VPRYLVTFTETFEIEADDAREAEAAAEERSYFDSQIGSPNETVLVEILEGVTP